MRFLDFFHISPEGTVKPYPSPEVLSDPPGLNELETERRMVRKGLLQQGYLAGGESEKLEMLSDGLLFDDFSQMRKAFDHYRIKLKGMPTQAVLQHRLQPVLKDALRLYCPRLLLIPPLPLQQLIKAIDKYPVPQQRNPTIFYNGKNHVWNGGQPENIQGWEVKIVEGMHNPKQDQVMSSRSLDDYEKVQHCLRTFTERGVDVVNDARAFLVLVMLTSAGNDREELLDTKGHTLLNAKNLKPKEHMMTGSCKDERLALFLHGDIRDVHLRGVIDVPEYAATEAPLL